MMRRRFIKGVDWALIVDPSCNTPDDVLFRNIKINSRRGHEWLHEEDAHEHHALLVGHGPSLPHYVREIADRQARGAHVLACNGAAPWLKAYGITPDWAVVLDARPDNFRFIKSRPAAGYLLASQVDPALYDHLEGEKIVTFHPAMLGIEQHLPKGRKVTLIDTMGFVGLAAAACAVTAGFRNLHFFGYDSSDLDGQSHASYQPETAPERERHEVLCMGKTFHCSTGMMLQAEAFPQLAQKLAEAGCNFSVRGDGLLQTVLIMSVKAAHEDASGVVVDAQDLSRG